MEKYILNNGITLLFQRKPTKSVTIEAMFKVGSNYENAGIRGISHFLEHMLFEGTKKRPDSTIIATSIEKYGAEFNAYTSTGRTAFFIKIMNKHFGVALDVLSDIVANSTFKEDKIKKEKKVILREIDMINDDPKQRQWILFKKALFERHPTKNPAYGTVETVKSIDRKKLIGYYKKYYLPNNMILSIVGNISNAKPLVEEYFNSLEQKKSPIKKKIKEPKQRAIRMLTEKRKIQNSYIVLGYKTVPRIHKDSYTLDIIVSILGRGQSGWIFDIIRNKHGLAYQIGVQNENEIDYGAFAVYAGLMKKNIPKAKGLILEQFKRLQLITKKELNEAKTYIEGHYALEMEDNFHAADELAFWELIEDAHLADSYIKNIKSVTVEDVKRVARKYLNNAYTFVAVEQE